MIILLVGSLGIRSVVERRRLDAAWRRVGQCAPVTPSSAQVSCTGVTLVELSLPPSFAACREIIATKGVCSVPVNREAAPAFLAAFGEIDEAGLGRHITKFETVNRRRCKHAISGNFIPNCVSKHSYGIAADIRPFADNANWQAVTQAEPGLAGVITIFQSHGFRWGMDFASNPDPQHVEWSPR